MRYNERDKGDNMSAKIEQPVSPVRAERIAEGIYWGRTYFYTGPIPTKDRSVSQGTEAPPWGGWGNVLVIDRGTKLVTVLCPHQLESFQMARNCIEIVGMVPAKTPCDLDKLEQYLNYAWQQAGKYGWQRDFDTTAMVLQALGRPVPTRIVPEGAEPEKSRGGSQADDVLGLLKPVKRKGRRGEVLAFFLPEPKSIREAMAVFGVTRSNLLSQLWLLNKEHGIGYELVGEMATVTLPAGCEDPFEPEVEKKAA
jgi:hypothetical protein